MISHAHALDRKIKESNLEEIYGRLCLPKTDQGFSEVLAELGREIANNQLFELYIRNIVEKETTYRKTSDIDSVIHQTFFNAQDKKKSNQEMLVRKERISEYFSLWLILRFNELYDISLHSRVRNELEESGNLRNLADFEEGIIVVSNILEGKSNVNLADYYLPHAHRVISEIIQFLNKQQTTSNQDQDIHNKNLPLSKNNNVKYKPKITITVSKDKVELFTADKDPITIEKYDNKRKQNNLRFKLLTSLCDHHSQGLTKKQLEEELQKKHTQINRSCRGINDQVIEKWGYDDFIKKGRTGRMSFNDKYHILYPDKK